MMWGWAYWLLSASNITWSDFMLSDYINTYVWLNSQTFELSYSREKREAVYNIFMFDLCMKHMRCLWIDYHKTNIISSKENILYTMSGSFDIVTLRQFQIIGINIILGIIEWYIF